MPITSPAAIETFETAAARDVNLPTPRIGQGCFLVSTGGLTFYYGPSLGWLPPWNSAWGKVVPDVSISAPVAVSPAVSGAQTYPAIAGLSSTFTYVPGRAIEAIFDGLVTSGSDGDIIEVFLQDIDGVNTFAQTVSVTVKNPATVPTPLRFAVPYGHLYGPSILVTIGAAQISGSGGQVYGDGGYPSRLTIRDIGPAANPTYR